MGSGERTGALRVRILGLAAVVLLSGVLTACAPGDVIDATQTPPPPTPTEHATATPIPPSATPLPASSPTVAPTPDLGWLLDSGAASLEYRIPLMTRHVAESAAWLQYELPGAEQAELVVWPVDRSAPPLRMELREEFDVVRIDRLRPSTRYAASIVVGEADENVGRPTLDGELWPPVEFSTQPPGAEFRVGVIGDSGFDDPVTVGLVEQMSKRDLDFTIHTGDLVYRVHENPDPPSAFVEKLYEPLAPLLGQGPLYPVPGNHEYDAPARWNGDPYYRHAFPAMAGDGLHPGEGSWYAFEYGEVQFIMLDSQVLFGVAGESAQEAWLEERLATGGYGYTVVVLHVPPYSVGRHRTDSQIVHARWGEYFASPGVGLVLSGHDHNYQRFLIEDRPYVVTGGGSAVTYTLPGSDPRLRASSSRSHFVLLTFEKDRMVVEAVDEQGISLDWAELPIPESTP